LSGGYGARSEGGSSDGNRNEYSSAVRPCCGFDRFDFWPADRACGDVLALAEGTTREQSAAAGEIDTDPVVPASAPASSASVADERFRESPGNVATDGTSLHNHASTQFRGNHRRSVSTVLDLRIRSTFRWHKNCTRICWGRVRSLGESWEEIFGPSLGRTPLHF